MTSLMLQPPPPQVRQPESFVSAEADEQLGGPSADERDWTRVEVALASRDWDFRSIEGIAAELQLPPNRVKDLLEQHEDKVRTTLSSDYRVVYALKSKPYTLGELWDLVATLASYR